MLKRLAQLFGGRKTRQPVPSYAFAVPPARYPIHKPDDLLRAPAVQAAVHRIQADFSHDDAAFDRWIYPLLRRAAAYYQSLPASQRHHHCGAYGALVHILDVAAITLRSSSGRDLRVSSRPDVEHKAAIPKQACLILLALTHDAGKPLSDIAVHDPADPDDVWHPLQEPLHDWARARRLEQVALRWIPQRVHREHENYTSALAWEWLKDLPETPPTDVLRHFAAALKEEEHQWAELVRHADSRSVAVERVTASAEGGAPFGPEDAIVGAIAALINEGTWEINRPGHPVWYSEAGLHLVFPKPFMTVMRHLNDRHQDYSVPASPEAMCQMLCASGWIKADESDGRITPSIERILPPGIKDSSLLNVVTFRRDLPEWAQVEMPRTIPLLTYVDADGVDLLAATQADREDGRDADPTSPGLSWGSVQEPAAGFLREIARRLSEGGRWADDSDAPARAIDGALWLRWKDAFQDVGVDPEDLIKQLENRGLLEPTAHGAILHKDGRDVWAKLSFPASQLVLGGVPEKSQPSTRRAGPMLRMTDEDGEPVQSRQARPPQSEERNDRGEMPNRPVLPPKREDQEEPAKRAEADEQDNQPDAPAEQPRSEASKPQPKTKKKKKAGKKKKKKKASGAKIPAENQELELELPRPEGASKGAPAKFLDYLHKEVSAGRLQMEETPGGDLYKHPEGLAVSRDLVIKYTREPVAASRSAGALRSLLRSRGLLARSKPVEAGTSEYWVLTKDAGRWVLGVQAQGSHSRGKKTRANNSGSG